MDFFKKITVHWRTQQEIYTAVKSQLYDTSTFSQSRSCLNLQCTPSYVPAFLCTRIVSALQLKRTMQPFAMDASQRVSLTSAVDPPSAVQTI